MFFINVGSLLYLTGAKRNTLCYNTVMFRFIKILSVVPAFDQPKLSSYSFGQIFPYTRITFFNKNSFLLVHPCAKPTTDNPPTLSNARKTLENMRGSRRTERQKPLSPKADRCRRRRRRCRVRASFNPPPQKRAVASEDVRRMGARMCGTCDERRSPMGKPKGRRYRGERRKSIVRGENFVVRPNNYILG